MIFFISFFILAAVTALVLLKFPEYRRSLLEKLNERKSFIIADDE